MDDANADLDLRFRRISSTAFAHGLERRVRRCVCVPWDTSFS